jgi:hypothetical protein
MAEPTAPTTAERLRSLLVAEPSLDVVAAQRRVQLIGRHEVESDGRLRLRVPGDSLLALELAEGAPILAVVEITDIAAVAMRDRIRARASLSGMLQRHRAEATDVVAELALASGDLVERGMRTPVSAAEFAAAAPDVLASRESALLCHLVDVHADLVGWLTRLVPAGVLHGVRRVHPLRLDRYGIVLRLEFPCGERDVRLPFSAPAEVPEDAPSRMLELLARARACRRRVA